MKKWRKKKFFQQKKSHENCEEKKIEDKKTPNNFSFTQKHQKKNTSLKKKIETVRKMGFVERGKCLVGETVLCLSKFFFSRFS